MLTAKNVSAKTAVEYFFRGASQKGAARWSGEGAQKLGLSGAINNEEIFSNIAHGLSPDGSTFLNGRKLSNNKRRAALDCTFSAPKTVSLIALVGGDYRLIEAHIKAVKQSLNVAEPIYARARIRSDGKQKPIGTGNLLVAEFDHIESRELDPQLHTHCLLMNMTEANGKWYSLSNSQVFKNKTFLGMTYQSFLAAEVKKLGYEVEAKEHGQFDIKGFSEQQIKAFSKRRQKILAQAGESATRVDKDRAWNTTRKHKKDVTQSELKADWRQQAAALEIIFELPAHPEYEPVEEVANNKSLESALDQAIAHWSERNVSFKHEDLGKFILSERLASNVTQIDYLINQHKDLIDLPGMPGHYTTWRAVEREVAIIDLMRSGQDKLSAIAQPGTVENRLVETSLNEGQRQAVQLAATTTDQFVAWQGVAGAGKTFAVNQLKAIATDAGYTVKGFAPNSIATKVLGQDTGMKTRNVASLLCSKLPPEPELNQLWIIDEAGLLSASDAHALLERAVQEQARVVFIGDTKQFSSVGAGNPFKLLQQEGIKTAHLTESRRQQNPELKLAVDLIADNRIQSGFRQLQAMGSIVCMSPEEKLEIIANEYMARSPEARSQTLVLAGTNKERLALTQAIRSKLQTEGSLGEDTMITQLLRKDLTKVQMENLYNFEIGEVVMPTRDYKRRGLEKGKLYTLVGKGDKTLLLQESEGKQFEVDTLFEKAIYRCQKIPIVQGDILRWRKNENDLGRSNGEDFVVTRIDGDTATIKYLESDERIETLNLKQAQSLDYAIVSTVYSSQGKTAESVLVADDWTMGKESFYVAASRAKQELKIYTHDSVDMLQRVEKSKTKHNALEVLRQQVREKQAAERAISIHIDAPLPSASSVASPVLKTPSSVSQPVQEPILKKQAASTQVSVVKPVLKPAVPTEAFWIPKKTEKIPNFIEPNHWQEFENSTIHPDIAAKNFESLQFSYAGGEHEAWERIMVSEKLNRTNTGRLTQGLISAYSHLDAGGWWCDAGVDPRTFAGLTPGDKPVSKRWGCYKPNMPRPKKDEDGQVIEGKFIKYEHPPKVDLSIFLLDVPQDIAERIYQKSGVEPSNSDRQSGFWYCVWKHNIPITITEGAKKAASLLSQGHAAIGLPGISAGYRSPKDEFGNKIEKSHLHEELAVFATPKREISFCFDYETKPKTLRNVEIATSQTGRLLERQGVKVRVVSLPGPDKGVDDFIMAQGPLAYEKVSHSAMTLRDWQRHNQKQRAATIEPPRKLAQQESSSQQNQTKEQTDDRQQLNSDTVINRKNRAIVNQPRETKRENRAVRNESSRESEQHQNQSFELLAAISRYVEFQEIEQLGADITRINQSLADGWFRGQRTANFSTNTLRQNSAIIDRTESHGHPQQPANEQLLNAIADFLETAAIESTNIVKDLQALTENLGHYQNQDSVRAIVLDVATSIADFIDQSAVETTLVERLPQVTEQLSQYQQQLANEKAPAKQLEQLLTNKPVQNQALGAITEYLELQAVEVSTVEIALSKLVDQLKQLPQPEITSNNHQIINALVLDVAAGIADFINQSAVEATLVEALPSVAEQLPKYQQQLASATATFNQLEQLLTNQPAQKQALKAITEYVELQSIEASTVEIVLSKLVKQLKQLPQHSLRDTQQDVDNLLKAISEYVEQDSIATCPAVSALSKLKTQIEQSQSHAHTVIQQFDTVISASLNQLKTLLLKQQQQIEKQLAKAFFQHLEQSAIQSESITQAFEIIKQSLSIPSDNARVIQQLDTVISYYIELINEVNQLSDQEFLLLRQNVVDYFQKQPLYPLLTDKQLLQNEIEQFNTQIQNLWQEQVKYLDAANQLEKKIFYKWDQKYTKTVAKIEQTAGFIDSLTAQKQQKEIKLKQWDNQAQVYCNWEQEPRTSQMKTFNQVFQLPQMQERLRDIQQKQAIKIQSQKQRPSVPRL